MSARLAPGLGSTPSATTKKAIRRNKARRRKVAKSRRGIVAVVAKLQCQICDKLLRHQRLRTTDHILPVEYGGTDDLENLRLLCWPCHEARNTRWNFLKRVVQRTYGQPPRKLYGRLVRPFEFIKSGMLCRTEQFDQVDFAVGAMP